MIEYLNYSGLSHFFDKLKALFAKKTQSIKNISRNGTTFTATRADGSTFTFDQQTPGTATSAAAGFMPPLNQDNTKYLDGTGNWTTPVNIMTGATNTSAGTAGLVPAPAAGKNNDGFLKGDATWEDIKEMSDEDIEEQFLEQSGYLGNYLQLFDFNAINYPLKSLSQMHFGLEKDSQSLQDLAEQLAGSFPTSFQDYRINRLEINIANKNLLEKDELREAIYHSIDPSLNPGKLSSNYYDPIQLPNGKTDVLTDENDRIKIGERIFVDGVRYLITLHVVSSTTRTMFDAVYKDGTVVHIRDCFNGEYAEYESDQNLAYLIMNNSDTSNVMTFYPDDSSIVAIEGFYNSSSTIEPAESGLYFSDPSYYAINSNNFSKVINFKDNNGEMIQTGNFIFGGRLDLENKILYTDYDYIQSYVDEDAGEEWLDSTGLSSFNGDASPSEGSQVIYYHPQSFNQTEEVSLSSINGTNLMWMKLMYGINYLDRSSVESINTICAVHQWDFAYFRNDDPGATGLSSDRDLSNDFISDVIDTSTSYPVPAVGDSMKVILGKVIKFFSDITQAFAGATSSAAGTKGLVPTPTAGEQIAYLRGDGTWEAPVFNKTTTATGFALDAREANPNVSGSLAADVKSLDDSLGGVKFKRFVLSVATGSSSATKQFSVPSGYRGLMIISTSSAAGSGLFLIWANANGLTGYETINDSTLVSIDVATSNSISLTATSGSYRITFMSLDGEITELT